MTQERLANTDRGLAVVESRLARVENGLVFEQDLSPEARKGLVLDPQGQVPEEKRLALTRQHLGGHETPVFSRVYVPTSDSLENFPMTLEVVHHLDTGTVVVGFEELENTLATPSNIVAYLGDEQGVKALALAPMMVVKGTVLSQQEMVHPGVGQSLDYLVNEVGNLGVKLEEVARPLREQRAAQEKTRVEHEAYLKWLRECPVVALRLPSGQVVLGSYGDYKMPEGVGTALFGGMQGNVLNPLKQEHLHTLLNAARVEGHQLYVAGRPRSNGVLEVSAVLLPSSYTPNTFLYRLMPVQKGR